MLTGPHPASNPASNPASSLPESAVDAAASVADAAWHAGVLRRLKQAGHVAAGRFDRRLAGVEGLLTALTVKQVAEILADAEVVSRVIDSGAAANAQQEAAERVHAAYDALSADAATAGTLCRLLDGVTARDAAAAAGAVGRLQRLASALAEDDPARRKAVEHWVARLRAEPSVEREFSALRRRLRPVGRGGLRPGGAPVKDRGVGTPLPASPGSLPDYDEALADVDQARWPMLGERLVRVEEAAARARVAAMTRASVAALDSLADAAPGPAVRASWLVERLARRVVNLRPTLWETPPPPPDVLAWLRRVIVPRLYEPEWERWQSSWLGIDLFGLRRLPPAPDFLAGVDVTSLRPEHVGPLLRRLSMTRPAPRPEELSPSALDADRGAVSWADRSEDERRWGQPADSGVPLLPERIGIPHVVHGMWLGQPMPPTTVFWDNYAAAARHFAGEVDVVLWVDVPRAACEAALSTPAPEDDGASDPLADVRTLVTWARESGVLLVNVHEVFHAGNPILAHPQYVLEMSKQLPRGYTAAGDHLRVELVHAFGGLYIDGDIRFHAGEPNGSTPGTVQELLDAVATSRTAFTLNVMPPGGGIGNDLFAAPAGHPALRLWLECMRINYYRGQVQICSGLNEMTQQYAGTPRRGLRYLAPHRTGRLHHTALTLLKLGRDDLVYPGDAIEYHSETTWFPKGKKEKASPGWLRSEHLSGDQVVEKAMRVVTFLVWQAVAREGNLYLCAADPVVSSLPDPDAAWIAVLRLLAAHDVVRRLVTSVTDLRWDDDRRLERVRLPQQAEAFLDRTATPATWFGSALDPDDEGRVWLLDDAVLPAALRRLPSMAPVPEGWPILHLAPAA